MKKNTTALLLVILGMMEACTYHYGLGLLDDDYQPSSFAFQGRISLGLHDGDTFPAGFCQDENGQEDFGSCRIVTPAGKNPDAAFTLLGAPSLIVSDACVKPYLLDDSEVFPTDVYRDLLPYTRRFPVPGHMTAKIRLVADNAIDEIFLTLHCALHPNPNDKFGSLLKGTFTIANGTGRYTGATGGGVCYGSMAANVRSPDRPTTWLLDGRISY